MTKISDLLKQNQATEFTDDQLGELGQAANQLIEAQHEIEKQEEVLKQCKAVERKISQETIPTLMENLGFEKITLKTGQVGAVKDNIQVSIPAALKPKAYHWLEQNNHGDLIKSTVTAKFSRGEADKASEAFNALIEVGANPNQIEAVHPGTLKAWAREELAIGHSLPEDLFKIHIVKMTTVK